MSSLSLITIFLLLHINLMILLILKINQLPSKCLFMCIEYLFQYSILSVADFLLDCSECHVVVLVSQR